MSILEELVAPITIEAFKRDYVSQKEPFASPGTALKYRRLVSWPLLDEIFATGYEDCWLPQRGRLPEDPALRTGRLQLEQALRGFEEGRTVLIRHSERAHPKLAQIAQDFHELFHDPIDIQLYCTPAEEEGFDWHYDVEEVFVIQSSGEKEFRLRKNTVNPRPSYSAMSKNMRFGEEFKRELDKEGSGTEIRCLLKAGDFLFIPSGYWHKARALTPSFHLSVGVLSAASF